MILYMARLSIRPHFRRSHDRTSAHTPRFASVMKLSKIFAGVLAFFFRASAIAARKFFPLRNNR
jgi:hypothetical protein